MHSSPTSLEISVSPRRRLCWGDRRIRCAVGRGGIRAGKREGDGVTPAGVFPLRRVFYRPDRLDAPSTALPLRATTIDDGWCDDPADALYNRPVRLPYPGGHERLWRDDGLYDLLAVIGYNDDPVVTGAGSAIFLHVATPDYAATEGCVAVALADLIDLLSACGDGTRIAITED